MADKRNAANYPDLLGALTRGPRVNVDVVQCALAARPAQVPAGQVLELVVLLQNASDVDVDVTLISELPKRDLAKQKDRFKTKSEKLLIGLCPAEVGYAVLPVAVAPNAQPGDGYQIIVNLKVKQMARRAKRIRLDKGGGNFVFSELTEGTKEQMRQLRPLTFLADGGGNKNRLAMPFAVLPPVPSGAANLQANYVSLWSMGDYADDYYVASQVWEPAQQVVASMNHTTIFMPLLKAIQERFQECGYPLLPPEAIFIAKLMALVAELPIEAPSSQNEHPSWPRWFKNLCRLLVQQPALVAQAQELATQHLFGDLVYCSVVHGFAMVSNVTNEEFGSPDEINDYAQNLVSMLAEGEQLGFARAYLPLVLGGLIANNRITMPHENVRETVAVLAKALEKRQAERDDSNDFLFDMANMLIDRALEMS